MAGLTSLKALLDLNAVIGPPKTGSRRFWTNKEIETLKRVYPEGGMNAALEALPGRSASSIYEQARKRKVKSPTTAKTPYARYTHSKPIDDAIRRGYAAAPEKGRGAIKQLAVTVGRPVHYVTQRAKRLGLIQPRFKEPNWTQREEEFVATRAHQDLTTIQRAMVKAGFPHRTETSISMKIRRLGASTEDPYHYTGRGLAQLLGIDQHAVSTWISKGLLKAKRRGTDRTEANGGDMYWIHRKDIRAFIIGNAAVIDIRKVEKFWFIDLLADQA